MTGHDPSETQGTKLAVTLAPVTPANWQAVIALRVANDQAGNLASNLYSLAEAYVEPRCRPRAIVAGRTVVGFAMYEYVAAEEIFNIPRFMIDVAWQGYGYGRAGLARLLEELAAECPTAAVTISLKPDNTAARRLYARLGFEDTGRRVHGEDIMRRPPGAASGDGSGA
ncbi:GNAT family N-acetyltransferase [Salinisphaera hydrothermalis]|uniref:Acetyltransferase n=1 Tax=Salinisphaera hydrothermalis (strain C41B8) TaxID=1304275 RepID=A0A084IN56_SALHC|nr:GNAT family N-acetyltransferase [Salinisphaera hydrothermalis]KEZ78140.1 acetyltransferase [Salinisphaera hydrothermalis C41B8]